MHLFSQWQRKLAKWGLSAVGWNFENSFVCNSQTTCLIGLILIPTVKILRFYQSLKYDAPLLFGLGNNDCPERLLWQNCACLSKKNPLLRCRQVEISATFFFRFFLHDSIELIELPMIILPSGIPNDFFIKNFENTFIHEKRFSSRVVILHISKVDFFHLFTFILRFSSILTDISDKARSPEHIFQRFES